MQGGKPKGNEVTDQRVCLKSERLKEYGKLLLMETLKESVTSSVAIHKTNRKYGKQRV